MSRGSDHAFVTLGSLEPGTHLCAFHQDEGQLTRIAATFIGQGLSEGDQLLYVATDEHAEALLRALPDHVHAQDAVASGQLVVTSFAEAYGTRRPDDLGTVADGFRAAADLSRKRGFPGLRAAAQMDALAPLLGSPEEVLRWERMCTGLQREIGVSSVCLYDAARLDEEHAARLAREHAGLAPELAEIPLASFLAVDEPWGLRIFGEVDISNRDLLHRTLLSRAAVTPQLHLDLAGLTFADVGTLSRLRAVAAGLPDNGWLALTRVPAAISRVLSISGLHHERLRLEP
jgi:hypothetical protein